MKRLRKIHLYLGVVFSPLLILFAATGAAEMLGVHLGILSEVHLRHYGSLPFLFLAVLMSVSVIVTALLGISMAFRLGNNPKVVWACLAFGVLFPLVLLLLGGNMGKKRIVRPKQPAEVQPGSQSQTNGPL